MKLTPCVDVVMYHYVRDLPRTRFPRIKGMLVDDFRRQVDALRQRYEMATLETALQFLAGRYQPTRSLCLLTFDDGLREHYTDVLPILAERHIPGIFFLATACIEERSIVSVHKNHFLMAASPFSTYRDAFLERLVLLSPDTNARVDEDLAAHTFRWDTAEVAQFKYLLNFVVPQTICSRILDELFLENIGEECSFARELYLSWDEVREMQSGGMLIGGHSHRHLPLAKMSGECQHADLKTCADLLHRHCAPQELWPFSYPYGKPLDSFNRLTQQMVSDFGFCCAFSTQVGSNTAGCDITSLCRIDPKDIGQ